MYLLEEEILGAEGKFGLSEMVKETTSKYLSTRASAGSMT